MITFNLIVFFSVKLSMFSYLLDPFIPFFLGLGDQFVLLFFIGLVL